MRYLVLVIFSFFIISCGGGSSSEYLEYDDNKIVENTNITTVNEPVLDQLNSLRKSSGLIEFKNNDKLEIAAYNHALYIATTRIVDHYESDQYSNFTGVTPSDRAIYAGFKSTIIGENLSDGQRNEYFSLKGLMSAIYHRFGFLNFDKNIIGYGKENLSYVYDMGNSDLNNLCYGENYSGDNPYYISVCTDSSFKIEVSLYKNELNKTINANPSYVIFPYKNQINVTTSFYEESPDPLPYYNVSGYPISIEFNKNEYNMDNFSINSFTIYDDSNNSLDLAADFNDSSTILSSENDQNNHLSKYQFAIFPKERLDYGKSYRVEFKYIYNNESKDIIWEFTTENLNNLIVYDGNDVNISISNNYNLYVKPRNVNDIYHSTYLSCTYTGSQSPLSLEFYDKNTFNLTTNSSTGSCTLTLNKDESNENNITININ